MESASITDVPDWIQPAFDHTLKNLLPVEYFMQLYLSSYYLVLDDPNYAFTLFARGLFAETEGHRKRVWLDSCKRFMDEQVLGRQPFVSRLLIVYHWSLVDFFFRDLIGRWLHHWNLHDRALLAHDPFETELRESRNAIPGDDIHSWRRMAAVVERWLKRKHWPRGEHPDGFDRFDDWMLPLELSASSTTNTLSLSDRALASRALTEFRHVRHNIVHQGAIADTALLEHCHWVRPTPGKELMIDPDSMLRYMGAALILIFYILGRVCHRFGAPWSGVPEVLWHQYRLK